MLVTRANRDKITTDLEQQLREVCGPFVYRAVIPSSTAVEEAHANSRTILEWAPDSPAGTAYTELVGEVLKHGRAKGTNRRRRAKPDAA